MICAECHKVLKNMNGLAKHITNQHDMTKEEYYNKHIGAVSPVCICGNKKKFRHMGEGYRTYCSVSCRDKHVEPTSYWLGKKQPQSMIDKRRDSIEERFGVNNGFLSAKTQTWHKGFFCQSKYEIAFVDFCEEYDYTLEVPDKIQYEFEGRKRYYYPDFYVKELDTIVEVKSTYTWQLNLEMNIAKLEKCRDMNYNITMINETHGILDDWRKLNEYIHP